MVSWKKKLADVLTLALGALLFYWGINWITNYFSITPVPRHVELPVVEIPVEKNPNIRRVELLSSPFFTPSNPFSDSEYSLAPRIVLGGNFKDAVLTIQGEVVGNDAVFLLLNFNKISGVIKGVRSKENSLDVRRTLEKGGLFSKNIPISVDVNLLNDVLGASSSDFENYPSGERPVKLISDKQLPEVYKVLTLPFLRNGQFGGARIDSISITYSCNGEIDDCLIDLCRLPKSTQCITEKFNAEETRKWRIRNGI